jgi:hypothetical protein
MSVNLHQLDQIKEYAQAIAVLEEFVKELVIEFSDSIEGKTYLQTHPATTEYVGSWIDHLLYFGYVYESVTLLQMGMSNVEVIVTQIFPHKISLLDPIEANTAIPELIAFWQFLKREYQHPQAHKIIKLLKQVKSKFSSIMNDQRNFDLAKFSLTSIAKFELTNEAKLAKLNKLQHHQKSTSINFSASLPKTTTSFNDFVVDQELLPGWTELEQVLQELGNELLTEFAQEVPSAQEFQQHLANMTRKQVQPIPDMSQQAITILQQQEITQTTPGSILQDFQTLLNFIGQEGMTVGGKRNLIPQKSLAQINQQLVEPIQTDLQRPQQKSYPTINGLYLLLRATGMGKILQQGKKTQLVLDPMLLDNWQQMNLTERYFNLLEAWLIIANGEMLGERGYMSEGTRCLQYWSKIPAQGEKFQDYQIQQNLKYYPGFHNLALMKLFGLVEASYGKPKIGKGWRVKSVKQTAWGKALLQTAFEGWTYPEMIWDDEQPVDIQFGKLQAILQPYFPQWQKVIELPQVEFINGIYVFKVSWQQIWRRIAIASDMTLWDLSQLILQSVDFDCDHLDMFSYKNQLGRTVQIVHPYMDGSPSTDEMKIADLPLEVGSVMEYLFDFGDNWEFQLQLEEIKPDLRPGYGEIIASEGKAPEQYPDWEEY